MVFDNRVLIAALLGWTIAQIIKVPLEYLQTKRWNWALFFSAGGMPSSHSALVSGLGLAIGFYEGFGSTLFAIAVVIGMVVIYDATGIRFQAGKQAEIINTMINDLAAGHPLRQEQLKEVLGHTPLEVLGGVLLGLVSGFLVWVFWH